MHLRLASMIQQAGWPISADRLSMLSDYELKFLESEMTGSRSFDAYYDRVRRLGFESCGCVLDAGCGAGQWGLALVRTGNSVVGVDLSDARLGIAKSIHKSVGNSGMFLKSNVESLPFKDAVFDGIFCYGVFMFTNMPRALLEYRRVLRPGGKIYLNANALGWYLHLILDRALPNKDFKLLRVAVSMALRGFFGAHKNALVRRSVLLKWLAVSGFADIQIGVEGSLGAPETPKSTQFYPSKYYFQPSIWECVATKKEEP